MIYNLTLHPQNIDGVEPKPRLKPVVNPADYTELKAAVKAALNGVPVGSTVLVGGLGQYQALITDLGLYNIVFANFNQATKKVEGLIQHETWTRAERFQIE